MSITEQKLIGQISFHELNSLLERNFGFIVMGAGGDLQEWIDGISDTLKKENIVNQNSEVFSEAYVLSGNINGKNGRTDLVLIFSNDSKPNIGMLAMWRLRFGGISWIDDFIVNYREDYR